MSATCFFCGWRDAVQLSDNDGAAVPACRKCVLECVPDPPLCSEELEKMRNRIARALRFNPGASSEDLRELAGAPERWADPIGYGKFTSELSRLSREGFVRMDRHPKMPATYTLVREVVQRSDASRRAAFQRWAKRKAKEAA